MASCHHARDTLLRSHTPPSLLRGNDLSILAGPQSDRGYRSKHTIFEGHCTVDITQIVIQPELLPEMHGLCFEKSMQTQGKHL